MHISNSVCLVVGTLIFLLFAGCKEPTPSKPQDSKPTGLFATTAPSKIYFNNIRSIQYYRNRKPGTKLDVYRHKKFSMTNKRPIIYPLIIDNWMKDEAYLFVEQNTYPSFSDPLKIR